MGAAPFFKIRTQDFDCRLLVATYIRLLLVGAGRRRLISVMMTLHALLAVGLHLIPLLLLGGIEEGADLIGGGFVNLHHLFVALIARHGGIAVHGLHLRLLGLKIS